MWTALPVLSLLLHISELQAISSGFYADNGLDQTMLYQEITKRERREVQDEILNLLGLPNRPKPVLHETKESAPRYMLHLYESISGNTDSSSSIQHFTADDNVKNVQEADIIMSFINHGRKAKCKKMKWPNIYPVQEKSQTRHDRDRRFWFDVSEVNPSESIMLAELRIYKMAVAKNDVTFNLAIHQMVHKKQAGDYDFELSLLHTMNVSTSFEGWLKFNVTKALKHWIAFPESNLGLYLTITAPGYDQDIHRKEVGLVGNKGGADKQPFLIAYMHASTSAARSTSRRSTRAAKRNKNTGVSYAEHDSWDNPHANYDERVARRSCQKRTLYVSFRELGWQDWIIAPDGYAAFYCHGECSFPLNAHMNATNHAIVQTLVHLMNPYQVPKPCCAPSKLSAISVLYFDDNSNVILKKYRNMVVKTCGCH